MKNFFFMQVTLLAFNIASAQNDKQATTAPTTSATETVIKQSEPQPLKKADGRITSPDAKVPVVEKRKEGDGKGPIKSKPAPPATTTSRK